MIIIPVTPVLSLTESKKRETQKAYETWDFMAKMAMSAEKLQDYPKWLNIRNHIEASSSQTDITLIRWRIDGYLNKFQFLVELIRGVFFPIIPRIIFVYCYGLFIWDPSQTPPPICYRTIILFFQSKQMEFPLFF